MPIYIFSDRRKRPAPLNIEPRGGAAKTVLRPVCAGFNGLPRGGTTLIAAKRTGRLNNDPAPVDAIIHRREALTGGSGRDDMSGRSFDDLVREAEIANAG